MKITFDTNCTAEVTETWTLIVEPDDLLDRTLTEYVIDALGAGNAEYVDQTVTGERDREVDTDTIREAG